VKTYYSVVGFREQMMSPGARPVVFVREEGVEKPRKLPERRDLYNHSPGGFAWGYGGSGPAQLALAILADLTDDRTALRYYQHFKFKAIAGLEQDQGWELTEESIRKTLAKIEEDHPVPGEEEAEDENAA
jgi:hypothetical protein